MRLGGFALLQFFKRLFHRAKVRAPTAFAARTADAQVALTSAPTVSDVFNAGGLPSITYVSRDDLGLEDKIASALRQGHSFNIVTGPTKSGKTVLCRKVLSDRAYVRIEGAHIKTEADFWLHIAHFQNLPSSATRAKSESLSSTASVGGSIGIEKVAHILASASLAATEQSTASLTYSNVMVISAIARLLESRTAILVDDFHFIDPSIQRAIIRSLKAAVFDGLSVFLLAVPHRAFDALLAEADIEGRTIPITIPSWSIDDLSRIADLGFQALNVRVRARLAGLICEDAYGSPLLVQELCAEFCERNQIIRNIGEPQAVDEKLLAGTYKAVSQRKASPKIDRLRAGPETGRVKVARRLRAGGREDIYTLLLFAVSRLGPIPTTPYRELRISLKAVLHPDARMPTKAEVVTALEHLSIIARDKIPGEPVLEWLSESEVLILTDPFLMFYMRFAFRDREEVRLPPAEPALVAL